MLLNPENGNIFKIESVAVMNNSCNISQWESIEHFNSGDTEWLNHKENSVALVDLYAALQDIPLEDRSIFNNIKTKAYLELKKVAPYSSFEDYIIT